MIMRYSSEKAGGRFGLFLLCLSDLARVVPIAFGLALGDIPACAAEIKLSDWLEGVSLSGDLRLRQENFQKKSPGQVDRSRQRFRLRTGTDFAFPHGVEAKLRFASGTGEQVSTNQSFDNLSGQKGVWIDRVYLQWIPLEPIRLAAGRMANPFWTVYASDVVWDEDFNPEGFSQSLEFLLPGNARIVGNAIQMVVDEDANTRNDQWMFGEQVGLDFLAWDSRFKLAGAYYNWVYAADGTFGQNGANEGNRRTGSAPGALLNEFGVGELTAEISRPIFRSPVSLQGTAIQNFRARDNLLPREDFGFQTGLRLGKAAAAKSWEAAYFYKWVETDATVADVSDSDFGDGGTNRRGHIFWGAYCPTEWLQLKAKYFITQVINESLAPNRDDVNRLQMDVSVKF